MILPKVERDILGVYRSKLACITSFVLSYMHKQKDSLKNLIVDGLIEDSFEKDLYKTLDVFCNSNNKKNGVGKFMPKNILAEPKADVTYPIVNQADRVAYQLKHYHEIKGHKKDKYLEHKLSPDWVLYKKMFDYVNVVNK